MNPDVTGPEERRAESSTAGAFLHRVEQSKRFT